MTRLYRVMWKGADGITHQSAFTEKAHHDSFIRILKDQGLDPIPDDQLPRSWQ